MDDFTVDTYEDEISEALQDHVKNGLMTEHASIASDGSQTTKYRLTDKGIESVRSRIFPLAEAGKEPQDG